MRRLALIGAVVGAALTLAAPASAQLAVFNAKPLSGTEGSAFGNPRVVTFQDSGACNPAAYTITVAWGDNAPASAGSVAKAVGVPPGTCTYDAQADHTYARAGPYTYSVTVCNGASCAAPVTAGAQLAEAAVSGRAGDIDATARQAFNGPVGEIDDANTLSQSGDFTASIDWGDGTGVTPGQISGTGGKFQVGGNHTYTAPGRYRVVLTAVHGGQSIVLDPGAADVRAAPENNPPGEDTTPATNPATPATVSLIGVRSLKAVRTSGLVLRLRRVPAALRRVTLDLFSGNTRLARKVFTVPRHRDLAAVVLRWRLGPKTARRLRTGRTYGVRVRGSGGVIPTLAMRFVLHR